MTPDRIERRTLRELAEKAAAQAVPPWETAGGTFDYPYVTSADGDNFGQIDHVALAHYIAAASPDVILELLRELDDLTASYKRLEWLMDAEPVRD